MNNEKTILSTKAENAFAEKYETEVYEPIFNEIKSASEAILKMKYCLRLIINQEDGNPEYSSIRDYCTEEINIISREFKKQLKKLSVIYPNNS